MIINIRCASPSEAKSETIVWAAAGLYVASGMPSALTTTCSVKKTELNAMIRRRTRMIPKIHNAGFWPRYVLSMGRLSMVRPFVEMSESERADQQAINADEDQHDRESLGVQPKQQQPERL